jgi:competence protein ComEA
MKRIHALVLAAILSFTAVIALAGPVDINTADAQTLSKAIKGIGIKKAEAIVAYRKEHGAFKSVDDLAKVKGIGKGTVAKNRDNLAAGSPAKP